MTIPFVKTQALGNDFILVEQSAASAGTSRPFPELAQRICHRQFGVGADGLILWRPEDALFDLRIINRDGSEAECSGNGLRCVAAYLIESGLWPKPEIQLRTVSGVYRLRRQGAQYEADMGKPHLVPAEIPFVPSRPMDRVVDEPFTVGADQVRITACSTGNPHCSLFVDRIDSEYVNRIGPAIEWHPAFPNRTNVEFIRVINDHEIEVAFWERGVGRTFASGTGSCGATVASILNGKTGRCVTVHTEAGTLTVEWGSDERLMLTSTASVVAEGMYLEA
ncbi:MAG TPA: diaminopimelate epimerase [Terriglobia bacterium]|nr:diaminopimelate epimerase [Terriglobia bacterium]